MKKLISLTSVLSALIGLLIFQQSFLDYYYRVNMRSSVNGGLIDSKEYKMFKGQVISSTNPQKTLDALTKDAQEIGQQFGSYQFPTNPDAKVPEQAKPLADVKLNPYDLEWSGENRAQLVEKWDNMIKDTKKEH